MVKKVKSCIFISGTGTNLTYIIKNSRDHNFPIKIELIISNNPNAKGIKLAKKYLGEENVILLPIRMTAEDFSYYTKEVPSCFYRLGTANKEKGIIHGLHTSSFDIDENSLEIGMGLMAFLATSESS